MRVFAITCVAACALMLSSASASAVREGVEAAAFQKAYADISKHTGDSFLGRPLRVDGGAHNAPPAALLEMATAIKARSKTQVTAMNNCENCVYVLERIKQGYQYLLPSICVEIYSKENKQAPYGTCHEVLASLSVWGNNVRHWLHYGCYKAESYGAMELIRPCPSHIICSQMADFKKKAFCKKQDQEKLAPGT
jgi:hypothetical protein